MATNNPNITEMNALTLKVLEKSISQGDFFNTQPPFITIANKTQKEAYEKLGYIYNTKFGDPFTEEEELEGLDLAISELEGMLFIISTNISQLHFSYEWEVRVEAISSTFGKIVKIDTLAKESSFTDDMNIDKIRDKAIIWIWKEAKKRLIEGKFL